MARMIDSSYLLKHQRKVKFFGLGPDDESWGYAVPTEIIENAPTLTQPNEGTKDKNVPTNDPLTLEEVRLMIEPTPVWWDWVQGWALARKGMIISWNGVYYNFEEVKGNFYRCPPEEPLTCEGCVHEINEHENCNYCIRAGYLGDYYCRS